MHQNPVRAGLAARAADWPHSSAGWYEQDPPVAVAQVAYMRLGAGKGGAR
ncbi:MAG: hypothetical protein ACOZHQ_11525 [Thermodesulfobacteriota bacterium]